MTRRWSSACATATSPSAWRVTTTRSRSAGGRRSSPASWAERPVLQKVVDTLLSVPPWIALLIIAGLVFAEAALFFGFVLPGETAVVYGGVLAAAGKTSVAVVL